MEVITYTAARQNLAKTMDKVCKDRAPVIVTGKTALPACPLNCIVRHFMPHIMFGYKMITVFCLAPFGQFSCLRILHPL